MDKETLLTRTGEVIRETVQCGDVPITRETSAMDVRGWDSLSHTMILMRLEEKFGIQLPVERVLQAATVGDLVDIIAELRS